MYNPTPQIDKDFYRRQFLPKPDVTLAGYEAQYQEWLRHHRRREHRETPSERPR